ncbi:hypothetical protein BVRB_9g220700 isoform B [Beta vulgaris subsp. vulgaris]|nr:hypothetical protein BVRB_9g220700 isoform B [Beta vulgaris subsp. vulgaris]
MCYPIVQLPKGTDDSRRGEWRTPRMVVQAEVAVQREVVISGSNDGRERQCVCSPTSHPGSFRCRNHRANYNWTSHA